MVIDNTRRGGPFPRGPEHKLPEDSLLPPLSAKQLQAAALTLASSMGAANSLYLEHPCVPLPWHQSLAEP